MLLSRAAVGAATTPAVTPATPEAVPATAAVVAATPPPASQRPCAADLAAHCPGLTPGTAPAFKCLKQNESKLSDACQRRLRSGRAGEGRAGGFMGACRADLDKFCKGTQPGGGRLLVCLNQHIDELSPGCKSQLPGRN